MHICTYAGHTSTHKCTSPKTRTYKHTGVGRARYNGTVALEEEIARMYEKQGSGTRELTAVCTKASAALRLPQNLAHRSAMPWSGLWEAAMEETVRPKVSQMS